MSAPAWVRERTSPWVVAIIIGFALMLLANGVFIYVAVSGADRVVASYRVEPR
ncbi:MAG: hypothetical protein IRZ00_18760 [Gemmatimonadetes bacterium]|nr:hypothetical protein [Gemmatimonadota bacterium]